MFHWYPQCLQVGLKNTSGIPEDPCLPSLHPGHPFLSLGVRATRALLLSAALRVWRRLCPLTHTSKSNLVVGATMKPLHNTYTGRTSPFQLCCVSAIGQHNLSASFSMLHKSNSGEDIRTRWTPKYQVRTKGGGTNFWIQHPPASSSHRLPKTGYAPVLWIYSWLH